MKSLVKIAPCFLLVFPILAADVNLAWDAPVATPAITNFVIYASPQPVTNRATVFKTVGVTNALTVTVSNLNYSTLFYFVAASREGNLESAFSNVATNRTPDLPAPISLRIQP